MHIQVFAAPQVIILLRDALKTWMIRSVYAVNMDPGHAAIEDGKVDTSRSKRNGTGHIDRRWRWTSSEEWEIRHRASILESLAQNTTPL